MFWSILAGALLIFCLRVTDVSLGTLRIILVTRGRKVLPALIGFVEVSIWVIAISQVVKQIGSVWNVLGYGSGFAVGTLCGILIEERLALGYADVHIVSHDRGEEVAEEVREAGYGATTIAARGLSGPVTLIDVVVRRRHVSEILDITTRVDPHSFVTIAEARHIHRGYLRKGQ
jgi:uncharacterized protein YebE (UPF0316 family)